MFLLVVLGQMKKIKECKEKDIYSNIIFLIYRADM